MKLTLIAAVTTIMLGTSASAVQITFSLPNLTFPPSDGATVTKDACTAPGVADGLCAPEG